MQRAWPLLLMLATATTVRAQATSDIVPNDPPFAEDVQQVIERWCREMGVPFLGRADIGHDADNKVVPFGACEPGAAAR